MIIAPDQMSIQWQENGVTKQEYYKGQGVVGVWAFSSKIIYALCSPKYSERGLRMFDLDAILKNPDRTYV